MWIPNPKSQIPNPESRIPGRIAPVIGRTLSHYQIVDEISRGGMGVVYRAIDTRLNREVALKILPANLIADAARRARFVQEARAASALEHPNIAVIHEIDDAGGVSFIAMELIRGEKLSVVVGRGALAPARALECGRRRRRERPIPRTARSAPPHRRLTRSSQPNGDSRRETATRRLGRPRASVRSRRRRAAPRRKTRDLPACESNSGLLRRPCCRCRSAT